MNFNRKRRRQNCFPIFRRSEFPFDHCYRQKYLFSFLSPWIYFTYHLRFINFRFILFLSSRSLKTWYNLFSIVGCQQKISLSRGIHMLIHSTKLFFNSFIIKWLCCPLLKLVKKCWMCIEFDLTRFFLFLIFG